MDDKILKIMEMVFETPNLDISCSQDNCVNWDSLHHLNLIVELEDAFDMEFEPEEIAEMKNFNKVKEIILSKQ